MNIGTSLKTISKNQLCSFIGTGGYVELAENDVLSEGSIVTAVAVLPLLNSRNDKGDGILPPGYQKMEFLESTGTQYILTGFFPSSASKIEIDLKLIKNTGDLAIWCFSNADKAMTEGGKDFKIALNPVQKNVWFEFGSIEGVRASQLRLGDRAVVTLQNGSCILNAQEIFFETSTFSAGPELSIFRNVRDTTFTQLQIFSCKLWEENELKRDLIPCLDGNGTPCMFDTVKKQPFYNKGTGEFRVGIATLQQARELQLPDNTGNAVKTLYLSLPQEARTDFTAQKHLSELAALNWSINTQYRDGDVPADYTKVDFLESTGTQYINTGIAGGDNALIIEGRMSRKQTGSYLGFFGNYINEDTNTTRLITNHISDANLGLYAYLNIKAANSLFAVSGDYTKTFDFSMTSNQFVFNGITFQRRPEAISGASNNASINLFKFAASPGTEVSSNVLCYFFKISNADETLVHLIPAINPSGVPGMWDKVSKQFFENAGTGAFIAGIKTLNDARMLNDVLPVVPSGSTYSITLSLPVEASTDAPAQKALTDLAARGWSINVQYREDEIPAGYAKVSFLEGSGTQYIDTSFMLTNAHEIELVCQTIGGAPNTSPPFGAREYSISFYIHQNLFAWFFWGTASSEVRGTPKFDKQTITAKGGKLYSDGVLVKNYSDQVFEASTTCWVFNINGRGSSGAYIGKIFKFVVKKQDATELHLIPVINTAGVPGMWDTVSQQFFENVGTGQFRVGLASKEAVRNLYLEPNVAAGTTINLSVPAGTTTEDTNILKANNPNYTFNIRYRS